MRVWMLAFLPPVMLFGIYLATRILEEMDQDSEEGRKMVEDGDDELMKGIVTWWPKKNEGDPK